MTGRRSRRGHSPLAWLLALLALVVVLNTIAVLERLAGPLLMVAAVGLVVWTLVRRGHRPVPPGGPPEVIRGQMDSDAAEVIRLRDGLEAARGAAYAAWEDATEPGTRGASVLAPRARLLGDARSGARPL
jgi:hypothetical protein